MEEYSDLIKLTRMDTGESLFFQTVVSYSSNKKSTITTYPTSEGTPKADNIYAEPTTFSCSIIIGGSENINDDWGIGEDRPSTAMNMLTYFKDHAIKFQIDTPQGTYYNMYLTGINPNNNTENAYNLSAGLTFSELFIATYETQKVGSFKSVPIKANESQQQNNGSNNGNKLSNDLADIAAVGVGGAVSVGLAFAGVSGGLSLIPVAIGWLISQIN